MKRGVTTFLRPILVTYTYRWLFIFKMYNTIIISVRVPYDQIYSYDSETAEIKKQIKEITGHKAISLIARASF